MSGARQLRVLDLFSGIGMFSLGLERTGGFRTVAFCEINVYCQAVLRRWWSGIRCYHDVRELNATTLRRDLYDTYGEIDVICGGFPCQDISNAGLRAGIEGERSGLWGEFARLIGELRPSYVIVENVAAMLGRGLDTVLGDLAEIGYDAEWHCIPASYVGAPHNRDRIWIIAYPERGERRQEPYGRALGRMGREQQSVPWDRDWQVALREFRGVDDGHAYRVHRVDTIRNSIVPQIPEIIGRAIIEAEALMAANIHPNERNSE